MSPTDDLRFTVTADEAGRIDRVLARRYPHTSRRRLSELFAAGSVRIAGKRAKKGDRADAGSEIVLAQRPGGDEDLAPVADAEAAARLVVLHLDDQIVAVAKPPGMPSQPLRAGETGTAANGIASLHPECIEVSEDPRDGGLVHRLDIGTSGVLIAARTKAAWTTLRHAFGVGTVDKDYLALTWGAPVADSCDAPLAQRGRRVAVDAAEGLTAHTSWTIERVLGPWRLVRCRASTGRMHQVRAHLAHCGAPIAGDTLYGGPELPGLIGFFLHAAIVRLPGGVTIEAPLPPDRVAVLQTATTST